MKCCIRECAPAVPGQLHGSMRVHSTGLRQEVKPVPDLAIPLLVPRGTLRLGNQQTCAAQQELTLPDQESDLRIGLHNISLAYRRVTFSSGASLASSG